MSEAVGSMAEEAARLFGAVEGWLHSVRSPSDSPAEAPRAHSGPECRICPVCQLIHVVRTARPDIVEHLTEALTHLALAARVAIETSENHWVARRDDAPVEHIDIG